MATVPAPARAMASAWGAAKARAMARDEAQEPHQTMEQAHFRDSNPVQGWVAGVRLELELISPAHRIEVAAAFQILGMG